MQTPYSVIFVCSLCLLVSQLFYTIIGMAYFRDGNLITQGDGELATIAACIDLVGQTAPFFSDDEMKAEQLRALCTQLAGSLAMTYMLTPKDPIDDAPKDKDFTDNEVLGTLQHAVPEFGAVEHSYDEPLATLMIDALRFRVAAPACDEKEEQDYARALLMLEQLNT